MGAYACRMLTRQITDCAVERSDPARSFAYFCLSSALDPGVMWQHLLEQIYERIRPASLNSTGLM